MFGQANWTYVPWTIFHCEAFTLKWLIISTFVELLFSLAWCLWEWQLAEQMQSDCRVTPCSTSFDEKVFISQCELTAARSDNASLGRKDGWKLNLFCRMKMHKMDTLAYDYTYTTLHIKYWVFHVLFIKALSLIFENFKAKIKKILREQRTEEWCFTISTFQWIQFFSRPDYYWSQFSGILPLCCRKTSTTPTRTFSSFKLHIKYDLKKCPYLKNWPFPLAAASENTGWPCLEVSSSVMKSSRRLDISSSLCVNSFIISVDISEAPITSSPVLYNGQGTAHRRDSGRRARTDSGEDKHIHLPHPQVNIKITAGLHKYIRDPTARFHVS